MTFTVAAGEKWGIIGRNGTGQDDAVQSRHRDARSQRRAQSFVRPARASRCSNSIAISVTRRQFGKRLPVRSSICSTSSALWVSSRRESESLAKPRTPQSLDRYAHDLERFEREGGYEITARVDAVLHGLGFDPTEARSKRLDTLSGGERGRVGLARQLVAPADVLLLDEPTNHLDLETTEWLESYLRGYECDGAADQSRPCVSRERHRPHASPGEQHDGDYVGGYESFVNQRVERRLTQQRAFDKQQRQIAGEEDYIRRNIAGQNTKQAKGRRKRLERLPRLSPPPDEAGGAYMAIRFDVAERGGDLVAVAEDARIAIGNRVLIDKFTAQFDRGDRLGLDRPQRRREIDVTAHIAG